MDGLAAVVVVMEVAGAADGPHQSVVGGLQAVVVDGKNLDGHQVDQDGQVVAL